MRQNVKVKVGDQKTKIIQVLDDMNPVLDIMADDSKYCFATNNDLNFWV
jgi:hypothetical protein